MKRLRLALLSLAIAALLVQQAPVSAQSVNYPGVPAPQLDLPAKLAACSVDVDPTGMTPHATIVADGPSPATFSVVRFAFYDRDQHLVDVKHVSFPNNGMRFVIDGPLDTLICSVERIRFADGTEYGKPGSPVASAFLYALVLGGGAIALLGLHKSTSSSPTVPTSSPSTQPTVTPSPSSSASPSPSPTSSSTPGPITLVPTSMSFTATGPANAQRAAVSENNYGGTFTASSTTCNNIAVISPATVPNPGQYSVTAENPGTCSFTITDLHGQNATLSISVLTGSAHRRTTKA